MATYHEKIRDDLQAFDFKKLLADSNWGILTTRPQPIPGVEWNQAPIAEMNGVRIYEVTPRSGQAALPNAKTRADIHSHIETMRARENLVIFTDAAQPKDRTQSLWYWVKYDGKKKNPRDHLYLKGQPGDLFLTKLDSLFISMSELRDDGTIPLTEAVRKLSASMDVERVTKRFYNDFSSLRLNFIELIEGIEKEADRNWYASVLLNRLMFIYFLQKKGFIQNNRRYLDDKLDQSKARGTDRYYAEFLKALFFEGFAKPTDKRSAAARVLLGDIRYLNGGLFLPHQLEIKYPDIRIPDVAFENVLKLFKDYSWYLDDTPGAQDNEINPDVLGYIFEKYINQKAFGAYYTRTEITGYLCERTINAVIVDRVNGVSTRQYNDIGDILIRLDVDLCRKLLDILPRLSILDPACGSGAFLVAAMKTLLELYAAVFGKMEFLTDPYLSSELKRIRAEHPSVNYYIRKRIITDNLYGVDIMEEASEIARLRLFLFLVSSAQTVEHLEPLPNIDFNIMCGNSLIGLLKVDEKRFDDKRADPEGRTQQVLFGDENAKKYQTILTEKNRLLTIYRDPDSKLPADAKQQTNVLATLRADIEEHKERAYKTLNEILLDDFRTLGIKFEQAQSSGKAKKRPLSMGDIEALNPFHWGYEFDEIMRARGGFDVIIANPPWEIFKPNSKEFFAEYSDVVTKKKMRIEEFDAEQEHLLEDSDIRAAWLEYQSHFPHLNDYYRKAPQFANQVVIVKGKRVGTDINLYKLFTEQCFNLLRSNGRCGVVLPSGIYTDIGARQLREMLFNHTQVIGIFGFENRKLIFEGVDSRFKFVVLTFEKDGQTQEFPAAFMRHSVNELELFPNTSTLKIPVQLVRHLSPDSLSITEFHLQIDIDIAQKCLKHPLLSDEDLGWGVELYGEELHMTRGLKYFKTLKTSNPLFEGGMIWQFESAYAEPRYWIVESEIRDDFLDKRVKRIKSLNKPPIDMKNDYEAYRMAIRKIASTTNERTLVASMIPKGAFAGNSLTVNFPFCHDSIHYNILRLPYTDTMALLGCLNSFVVDYILRARMTTNLNSFFLYQLPIPRIKVGSRYFAPIVERAARLICSKPEFDDLAREVGIGSHKNGATDTAERARLRAEIDGMVAHLYGLTEAEFTHILGTFPLVPEPVKVAAQNAYRDVERGVLP